MKVLFVSSEVAPFSKTGGLGDVAGALPAALAKLGHQMEVVTPLYASVPRDRLTLLPDGLRLRFPFGEEQSRLWAARLSERHRVLFLEHPDFYDREGIYRDEEGEYPDNARRFAFLAVGALSAAQVLRFVPDIVHLNDWQTGLAAVALKRGFQGTALSQARSLFTIHNLAYQGVFPPAVLADLGLPSDLFTPAGLEFFGGVSFIKGGLVFGDALSTVSPKYAQEIQEPELGSGLGGLLRARRSSLTGILNGVDYAEWNPSQDRFLPQPFDSTHLAGKAASKREVLRRFGLPQGDAALRRPLFAVVSRLVEQKGTDLLVSALQTAGEADLSFLALGSGEGRFEASLQALARRFPTKVAVRIGFDPGLAHLMEGGADFFVMPSRYEPCGLNQMYSLRYGTVPIVRATGGLDDTVEDLSLPQGNGIKFYPFERSELLHALERAQTLYRTPQLLDEVRRRGMKLDHSWEASALRYERLYQSLATQSPLATLEAGAVAGRGAGAR